MRAFIISELDNVFDASLRNVEERRTHDDDVLIRVEFSGVNFKDAMVASPKSRVRRVEQLVGGVDAAGVVVSSPDPRTPIGTRVAVHGGALGVARDGGFAEFVYAPSKNITPLPVTISTRDAMVIGTAGFTAMASVLALEDYGLRAGGEVLVTGATGGVGSQSIVYLAARGYRPVASTGSLGETSWLLERGAERVVGRDEVSDLPTRVLGSERWDGAIDCVGGATLVHILRSLRYGCAVAASGLVGSAALETTVYPFITRSVALLGIDAVEVGHETRERVWTALGHVAPDVNYDALVDRVTRLEGLGAALEDIRNAKTRGRILVDPTPG